MHSIFLALMLFGRSTEPVVLVPAGAFLWKRRPEVRLAAQVGEASPRSHRLMITARDPQFFPTAELELTDGGSTTAPAVVRIRSDSSSVDARLSTNRHTLWFRLSDAELRIWGATERPGLRLGTVRATLDATGRHRLTEVIAQLPTPVAP
jgi:hypothetical protein